MSINAVRVRSEACSSRGSTASVLCIGLTPAYQRTIVVERFREGEVNRAGEALISPGGKAVNTGLALATLGRRSVITGLNGGTSGRFVADYLTRHGAVCAFTRTPWPTRTCTTILDPHRGCVTELVEEAHPPMPSQLQAFERGVRVLLRRAAMCFICGTLPPSVPVDFWARFSEAGTRAAVPILIDSHSAPLLKAIAFQPLLAKMNIHELETTVGSRCRSESAILAAARTLVHAGAKWVLITNGAEPAILSGPEDHEWRVTPPMISEIRSPIGSGDCVNAGLVDALLAGKDMPEAVCFGLGCGTANALTDRPADFDPARARTFASACRLQSMR